MKVFILEDMDLRIDLFKAKLKGHELTIAKTAKDAIDILKEGVNYDYMFLDHDLGGQVFVDSKEEETGYQVAKFLGESGVTCPILIHSMNYGGAKNMQSHIPQAVHIPFPILFTGGDKWMP